MEIAEADLFTFVKGGPLQRSLAGQRDDKGLAHL